MTTDFAAVWRDAFGATPPLGYRLRGDHAARWTRFHALPGSKRYAETEAERQTILQRAKTLGSSCFAPDETLWLVRCPVDGPTTLMFKDDDQTVFATAERVRWRPGRFDMLFTAIADDEGRALFFAPHHARVLAPYDGGFDLFDDDPGWIARLERDHRAWMSEREDRL